MLSLLVASASQLAAYYSEPLMFVSLVGWGLAFGSLATAARLSHAQ